MLEEEKKLVKEYLKVAKDILFECNIAHVGTDERDESPYQDRVVEVGKMVQMAHRWGAVKKTQQKSDKSPLILQDAYILTNISRIYVDAGCSGNGTDRQKAKIAITSEHDVIFEQDIGNYTNNEGEFLAIIAALRIIQQSDKNQRKLVIYSDSKLAVNMVNGDWKGKKPELKDLALLAQQEMSELPNVSIVWLPRGSNFAGIYLEFGDFQKR